MNLRTLLDHPEVRGVCIGSCVDGSRFTRGTVAHAHYERPDTKTTRERYPGFICVDTLDRLSRHADHDITRVGLEELAHLIARGAGKEFRTTMREMGQPIPAHHKQRKPRSR